MAQNLIVALLVGCCFVYALWTLAPKVPRSRLATWLLKFPLPSFLKTPVTAAARQQGGCGCDGCDRSTVNKASGSRGPADQDNKHALQPITFVRGTHHKKSLS